MGHSYASEKLQERRYAFSAQEVKQYFPEHKVVDGLFRLIQNLFNVEIKTDSARSGTRTCASSASSATAS
jgi:Zn-dependent oligopeptidase